MLADIARGQFEAHPIIGVGMADVYAAHNIYLQISAAVGVVGVAFFAAMLAAVLVRCLGIDRRFRLLILPAAGYVMVGALTTIIWDRFVWCVLALPFLLPLVRQEHEDADPDAAPEGLADAPADDLAPVERAAPLA